MDLIDKGILTQFQQNCRVTFEDLSRRHGITANAIKRRIQKLEENGVISGYSIILSPAMIDVKMIFGFIKTDGSQDERTMIQELGSYPQIIAAAAYTDGHYALVAEYATAIELSKIGTFLRGLKGAEEVEIHTFLRPLGKKMKMKKLHLRVLSCLVDDSRKSIVEIVKETGFSARRVRRALNEFIESEAVRFVALLELGAANSIPFLVKMEYDEMVMTPENLIAWIKSEHALFFWEAYISAHEPIIYALFAVDSLSEMESVIRLLREADFIKYAKATVGISHDYFVGPRHRKLREMLSATGYMKDLPTSPP